VTSLETALQMEEKKSHPEFCKNIFRQQHCGKEHTPNGGKMSNHRLNAGQK
jgi:hypothetical protein